MLILSSESWCSRGSFSIHASTMWLSISQPALEYARLTGKFTGARAATSRASAAATSSTVRSNNAPCCPRAAAVCAAAACPACSSAARSSFARAATSAGTAGPQPRVAGFGPFVEL
eukprot:scaffold116761_cov54-Phaeocystis_antarctica.AAC.1